MIRVAALTSGRTVPSARYRVRQHIAPLAEQGVRVDEYGPLFNKYMPAITDPFKILDRLRGCAGARKHDVTWLERMLVPGRLTFECRLKKPMVFDLDDAIWLHREGRGIAHRVAEYADTVIAGNQYLAEWASQYQKKVVVIPTAVDCERFLPRTSETVPEDSSGFAVGWTGLSSNLKYLGILVEPLRRLMSEHDDITFVVISDHWWNRFGLPKGQTEFIRWSPGSDFQHVRNFSAGVMPIPDTDWGRGKCSFKMLQYMAAGVPVVVSPVGMNAQLLGEAPCGMAARTEAEWYECLKSLYLHRDEGMRMGSAGRELVCRKYSVDVVARQLAEVFRRMA